MLFVGPPERYGKRNYIHECVNLKCAHVECAKMIEHFREEIPEEAHVRCEVGDG